MNMFSLKVYYLNIYKMETFKKLRKRQAVMSCDWSIGLRPSIASSEGVSVVE